MINLTAILTTLVGVLVGLLSLGIMMFFHELGHFLMGRALGFKIIEFSIFMGPRLLSWERNGIRYSLKLLPIGASVEFVGEEITDEDLEEEERDLSEEEERARLLAARERGDFQAMQPWKRALTLLAGPGMNLLTAFLIMLIYFGNVGIQLPTVAEVLPNGLAAEAGMEADDEILRLGSKKVHNNIDIMTAGILIQDESEVPLVYRSKDSGEIREVMVDPSPRETPLLGITIDTSDESGGISILGVDPAINNAGDPNLEAGDRILQINGEEASYEELQSQLAENKGEALSLTVLREGEEISLETKPTIVIQAPSLGVYLQTDHDFAKVPAYSFHYGKSVIVSTAQLLGQVFTGGLQVKDAFSGPVGIVSMYSGIVSGQGIQWAQKILQWLSLTFMISLALGFGNLLPIPPLDGGILVFVGIEKLLGRPINPRIQNALQMLGLGLFLLLAIYVLGIDIWRLLPR